MRAIGLWLAAALCCGSIHAAVPHQINYQGYLTAAGGAPVNATVSMVLNLYNVSTGGTALYTETQSVTVTNGVFHVLIGSVTPLPLPFDVPYYLGVTVGTDTEMTPRQPVAASGYAIRSASAENADSATSAATAINAMNATQLGGIGSSFNISGDGTAAGTLTANVVNAGAQYSLGGNRILSNAGTNNFFAGVGAGSANTTGSDDTFFGTLAGRVNTTGGFNSFFGSQAGRKNTASTNSFFGSQAGAFNTTGAGNSFFGSSAGETNETGSRNSFFGLGAGSGAGSVSAASDNSSFGAGAGGSILTGGDQNSFFGGSAGRSNTTGFGNSSFGYSSGQNNTTGTTNSFFGYLAGFNNSTGTNNTYIGARAGNYDSATQVSGSTAIGAFAKVDCSNCIVLGDATEPSLRVGIGTSPFAGSRLSVATGNGPNSIGVLGTNPTGTGVQGQSSNGVGVLGVTNGGVGVYGLSYAQGSIALRASGSSWFQGDSSPLSPANAGSGTGIVVGSNGNVGYMQAYDYSLSQTRILAVNSSGGNVGIGTATPNQTLEVNGRARVTSIPLIGQTSLQVCFNGAGDLIQCGASSLKWKSNVQAYRSGLDIVRHLRPIRFNWKEDGRVDIGLGAEEVAKVAPSFAYANSKGEVEGVKYERLNILLINAIKEQQAQIERQQGHIATLLRSNTALIARLRSVERIVRKNDSSPPLRR